MKDGRIVLDTLKLSSVGRHQSLMEPGMPRIMFGSGSQSPWLAKEFEPSPGPCRHEPSPVKPGCGAETSGLAADATTEKGAKVAPCASGQANRKAVPTLRKKTLKVSGRVPRVLAVRLGSEAKRGDEEPVAVEAPVLVEPIEAPTPVPVPDVAPDFEPLEVTPTMNSIEASPDVDLSGEESPVVELPSPDTFPRAQVKLIPTPKKRGPRSLAAEDEPSTPPVNKPLKVIRKRREQEPKVFETAPKPVPQAMLEGIKKPQENGDQPE